VFRRGLVLAIKARRDTPPDWSKEPFNGDGHLWMIKGKKNTNGELQGEWSEPEEVTGMHKVLELTGDEKALIEYLYCRAETKPEKPKGINIVGRKIEVYSFRHYYASSMVDKVAADKVAHITGHKTKPWQNSTKAMSQKR
jgi:hypothetical protein